MRPKVKSHIGILSTCISSSLRFWAKIAFLKIFLCVVIWYSANIYSNFKQTFSFKWSLLGKKGRREGCGHWKENPFLPTRFMHHPTKKEGCTNFSLSVAVICFYDDGKSISTIKLFPCFFFKISSALSEAYCSNH